MRLVFAAAAATLWAGTMCLAPDDVRAAEGASPPLAPNSTTPGDMKSLSAKDAGARYGEAAGAALVCADLKITEQVETLRARYQGDDLAEFDAQAAKVLKAWRQAKTCELADGPQDCKVSQQRSCRLALQEIGPEGSAVRGLVVLQTEPPGSEAPK